MSVKRARLKTIIQSILHAHLVPPCPHADLLGPKGRSWLSAQTLPPDEAEAVQRHLREHERLTDDLRVVERQAGFGGFRPTCCKPGCGREN